MNSKVFPAVILALLIGFLSSYFFVSNTSEQVSKSGDIMMSPDCEKGDMIGNTACEKKVIEKGEYSTLKAELNLYIDQLKRDGQVADVAVYFRDLENGPTMGINEYADFAAASLLKIPTLVIYFSLAEKNKSILDAQLQLDESQGIDAMYNQYYPPPERIHANTPYTVSELLRRAITYSDNVALEMLNRNLRAVSPTVDLFTETYKELGLVPDEVNGEYSLSVKRYSSIYRTLYTATYLSPQMSQRALELLTQSSFKSGLTPGVPDGIVVAHKFGERTSYSNDSPPVLQEQLHDCGIVYYPENPYLLCVMTRGYDYEKLEKVIQYISKSVYEEVDSRKIES